MSLYRKQKEYLPPNKRELGLFPTKKDDFLPYITDVVWSGFYTTRGGLKRHIWQAGQILQVSKHWYNKFLYFKISSVFYRILHLKLSWEITLILLPFCGLWVLLSLASLLGHVLVFFIAFLFSFSPH